MPKTYVALLRGINVGGKNLLPMAKLKTCFEDLGCSNVSTYIASGNVVFESSKPASGLSKAIQDCLPKKFKLDSQQIKVLLLSQKQLRNVIKKAPKGFGAEPSKYHSDIIFLMDLSPAEAFKAFSPKEGVDKIWKGSLTIYSQRLSALRTKSRLSKVMSSPLYKKMTIRTWNTALKLLQMMDATKLG